ncbi:dockerin type I domain-containing protein [Ruminococcus callidus]|uniref:dockerin type I domain-containing protein n=1 Tax=Ruminococcus callidus TaxID=40519 RepID=UPI00352018BB
MKTCRRKWFARWLAACIAVVLGMGMCAGLPVSAAYENTYTNTGNQRADIVAVAKTQIGYHEGSLEGTTNSSNNYTKYNVWNGKIEGGYRYAWCHAFVSWCANQAGIGTDIVPKTAGTSTGRSFFVNQGTYRQSAANGGSYVPQAGDIIYYGSGSSPSHVGIVSDCDGSTVYTIEGNYSNKVGTRAINLSNSYIIGYGVPNYKGVNPNPPKWAKVTLDHYAWMAGETLTFNLSSEGGVAYTVGIDTENADGGRTRIDTHDTRDTSYSRSFNNPGKYSCYITTYNEYGLADSERIYFEVYDKKPENVSVSLDHYGWMLNENMTFTCSSVHGYAYTIGIDDANGNRIDTYDTTGNTYTRSFSTPGKYSCYITTYNGYGYADSERIYFEVYDKKPENVSVSLDHYGWMLNENMTFTCSSVHGYAYTIGIDDANGNRIDTYDTTGNTYTRSFSTPGKYSCYITTYNGYGYADSERIYFEVYDKKPENVSVSLDHYGWMLNENMTFTCSSVHGYAYTIGIDDANGNRIDTYDTTGNTYTRSFSTPGKYSCYITTYNGYGYADSERIYFEVYDGKPTNAKVELDKDSYYVGEELVFRCSSEHGYVYTIGIDSEDGGRTRIDTYDTKESSYTRSFSKPGKYSCYITTYNGYGLADSERIYFTILPSPGDLNFDNTLTTADAVLLQRYLLQERTLTQSQWQTADLNADGTVNGFDLALLRQKLVG